MDNLRLMAVLAITAALASANAQTPSLKITTKHGSPLEERKKQQIERLASEYNLKKWTITRRIVIEQGVRPHSSPELTLNGRFLDNDDLTLSTYIHEQAHWLLMERHHGQMRDLYRDLKLWLPGLPTDYPRGDGNEEGTYIHLAVITLEWQGMEELVGPERARQAMDLLKTDHYFAIYAAVLEHRAAIENIMGRYFIRW